MRWSKQLKPNDCGVAVIANACKWAGMKFSLRQHHSFLMKELNISKYGGTYPEVLIEFIYNNKMPFKIAKIIEEPELDVIDKHLKKDRAIIMFFKNKKASHVFLIVKDMDKSYVGINYKGRKGPTVLAVPKSLLDNSWDTVAVIIERVSNG